MATTTSSDSKVDRMHFRLPSEIKERIEKAAVVSGQTVTDFAISTLAQTAEQVLGEYETRRLSARDRERFLAILDAAEAPNETLRAAAESYKKRFGK